MYIDFIAVLIKDFLEAEQLKKIVCSLADTGYKAKMEITVNDETRQCAAGTTVEQLLATLGLNVAKVAVERNQAIVPRSTFGAAVLAEGDRIEIIHFVGGG